MKTGILNKINIHVFRTIVNNHEKLKNNSIFLDYVRLESHLFPDNEVRLTFSSYNGLIFNNETKINLFRNIELYINFQAVTACDINVKNKISIYFKNFKTNLSFGRLNIPLEYFKKHKQQQQQQQQQQVDENVEIIDVVKYSQFVKNFMEIYSTTEITFEDFTLSHDEISINASNFKFQLSKIEKNEHQKNIKLGLYITSFTFYHHESKCFELPSGTISYEVCPIEVLKVSHALLNHDKNSKAHINFDLHIVLSNPIFDFYYDQQDILLKILRNKMMQKRMNKMRKVTGVHKKEEFMTKLLIASTMLKSISSKLVVSDTKINFHLPPIGRSKDDFNRFSKSNLIVSMTISGILYRIFTRDYQKLIEQDKIHKHSLNVLFKLKNIKGEADGNTMHLSKINLLNSYSLVDKKITLKISSKNVKFKSVNANFFHLVRQFRNRQIIYFNKKYDEFKDLDLDEEEVNYDKDRTIKLFEVLPRFISSIKFDLDTLLFDIICKEGLPSHKIYDNELGKEIDLADFRRGVSVKINQINANYKLEKEHIELSVKTLQAFTLSEYQSEYITDFDKVTELQQADSEFGDISSLNSLESNNIQDDVDAATRRIKNVLSVHDILLTNASKLDDRDINKLTLSIPEIDSRIDMFLLWCVFYAKTMLQKFAPTVASNCSKEELKRMTGPKKKLKLDVVLDSVACVIRLPRNVDILIEIESAKLKNALILKSTSINNARLYVIHPATKLWARLLIIKEPTFSIDFSKSLHTASFGILTRSILFNIPHLFLFYTVIDNFISFFKALKQLNQNYLYFNWGAEEFGRIYPTEKNAFNFPHIDIKTSVLGLSIENDPFENELAMIYELGLIEQKERMRKLKAFETKCEEIMSNVCEDDIDDSDIERKIELSNKPAPTMHHTNSQDSVNMKSKFTSNSSLKDKLFRRRKHNQTQGNIDETLEESKPKLTRKQVQEEIDEAKLRLLENFSKSWCRKYKVFRQVRHETWRSRSDNVWGKDLIPDVMKDKYDILDYSEGPPLCGTLFRDVDLTLDRFNGGDLDEFLYTYAKKQPKLHYSILVPLYLELKARKFYMILRDYPLPLASFPTSSNSKIPTIHIRSNIVVNEKLYSRKEELRYIYVPFSPAVPDNGIADNFYSVYIPRTLTPVKVCSDFVCDLNTDRACTISWCKAYQPALSTLSMTFENFSKPAIDDSPIGFWDKLPLIMHGRYQFNVANELCLHMKSGRSPHQLVGKNSGFVFCWKNNVKLVIDGTSNPKNLITLTSDDFLFAIPNYSMEEKNIWSLFYDDEDENSPDIDLEAKKFEKKCIKLTSSDRVKWVLGFMFERNKYFSKRLSDQELRCSDFKPHYEVMITNPSNEFHPDSYEGYRADYVHMTLSVISQAKSKDGEAFNTAFFTPLSFHHFFYWWDTLAHYSPPPIKSGKLFSQNNAKKYKIKFGNHMYTMKYQFIFNPVTISHLYLHSSNEGGDKKNRVAFTGLKGKFGKCEIDLHQRKEFVTYVNKKLDRKTQIKHLKMNQAEVNIEQADVRVLNALFNDTSLSGKLLTYLTDDLSSTRSSNHPNLSFDSKVHSPIDGSQFSNWLNSVEVYDGDFSWVDPEDFIELEIRETLSPYPKIRILPFFHTPKFSYFREFTLQKDGPFPFGGEKIHQCLMDTDKPAAVQSRILSHRLQILKDDMVDCEDKLRRAKNHGDAKAINHYEEQMTIIHEKLDVVNQAYKQFTEIEEVLHDDNGSLSKQKSNLSAYSSHLSEGELLSAANFETVAEFHNRFIIHNLKLRWDDDVREYFISYLQRITDRKNHVYYMTKVAVDLVEQVMNGSQREFNENINLKDHIFNKQFKKGEEVIDSFDEELEEVDNPEHEAEFKYLIKLLHPQIQMICKKVPDACVLLTSKDLEIRIIDVNIKDRVNIMTDNEMTARVETRFGILLRDEQLFVVTKDDVEKNQLTSKFTTHAYMSLNSQWPPWFECEICYDGSWAHEYLVSERNTVAIVYKSPNQMLVDQANSKGDELIIFLAKMVLNATSQQYSSIYFVATELLINGHKSDKLTERLERLMSIADASDFKGYDVKVQNLQLSIREYKEILLNFDQKGASLTDQEKRYLKILELEMEKSKLELLFIMKALRMRNKSTAKQSTRYWSILCDQVIWHFLDDERKPFVDFALANAKYGRVDLIDGTNVNKFEISMIQGFNLQDKPIYPELLTPIIDEKILQQKRHSCLDEVPVISMSWVLLAAVGGIPVIKNAKLEIQPLQLELDFVTARKLQSYLFPKDEDEENEYDEDSDSSDGSDMELMSDASSIPDSISTTNTSPTRNPLKKLIARSKNSLHSHNSNPTLNLSPNKSSASSFESSHTESSFNSNKLTKLLNRKENQNKNEQFEDDLAVIISRSLKFKSIIDLEIASFKLVVSFSAPNSLHVLDVNRLVINVPSLRYKYKLWSAEDFMDKLKKDVIKIILQHSGKIIGNKFKTKKKVKLDKPLKQISNYSSYTTLDDLQKHEKDGENSTDSTIHRTSVHHLRNKNMPHVLSRRGETSDKTYEEYLNAADDKVDNDIDAA
ncbi:unnamed protein product [Candida verbasci]|uniref:Uncharacterized protein n=1 Tax=Candida verbasci TaxID=1227364 RepID=A0A9W4U0I3_9ASCO|nr:unnamed protein product [Candida verbasci]